MILAAGASSRFGSPKQRARIAGVTLLERVVTIAADAGLAPVVAVVGPGIPAPPAAVEVRNDRPDEGLSRSLRLGVDAVPGDVAAAVILLGDQPTVSRAAIVALTGRAGEGPPVIATRAEGRIGPPVLLRREAFWLVAEARGDEGLAPVLARHPELVQHVDVPAHAPDVDTRADLAALGGG